MIRIPAPLVRGLVVLAIGTTVLFAPAAFAAPVRDGKFARPAEATAIGKERWLSDAIVLADNCYLERQEELTPQGRTISRLVHECD